jgi:DNA-directed RNA polymerase subunit D
MEKIEKNNIKITFLAKTNESLANAIRRAINNVPTLAIDEIEVLKNDSALYNETVAHRMGLIPLKTNKSFSKNVEKNLEINVSKEGEVLSKELKGEAEVIYDNIPITTLGEGQKLKIKAVAKLGIGKEHSKFSPGLMFYRKNQDVVLDKEFSEKIKEIFPENKISEKGGKIIVEDNLSKPISDVCEGIAEKKGKKAEIQEKDELIITLESFGQYSLEDIIPEAIKTLKNDLSDFSKTLK